MIHADARTELCAQKHCRYLWTLRTSIVRRSTNFCQWLCLLCVWPSLTTHRSLTALAKVCQVTNQTLDVAL